jgi:hypothetical protein
MAAPLAAKKPAADSDAIVVRSKHAYFMLYPS